MVKEALDRRSILSPSTDCILEAVQICLASNNIVSLAGSITSSATELQWGQKMLVVMLIELWVRLMNYLVQEGPLSPIYGGTIGMI